MNQKISPLQDCLLVKKQQTKQSATTSGIILPETSKEKPGLGSIVAVGPGKKDKDGALIPMKCKVGEVILFGKYAGTEIDIDGQTWLLVPEHEVLAKIL